MSTNLLKIKVQGVRNYVDNTVEIDFTPDQRVSENEIDSDILEISKNVQVNSIFAISGINASGKTTTLKIISLIVDVICKAKDISTLEKKDRVFMNSIFLDEVEIEIYWIAPNAKTPEDSRIFYLKSKLKKDSLLPFPSIEDYTYNFMEEHLQYIDANKITSKKNLFDIVKGYEDFKIERAFLNRVLNQRVEMEENIEMVDFSILESRSIMSFFTPLRDSFNILFIESVNSHSNLSFLKNINFEENVEIIKVFDPSVESIKKTMDENNKSSYTLKFYNQEEITLNNGKEFSNYLSTGTIQGIEILCAVRSIISSGGILLIDEIENHLNKAIIKTIIKIFLNESANELKSQLIFTTHYGELLDLINRRDSIFIVTRNNHRIKIDKSSNNKELRKELKNSALFFGGHFGNGIEHQRLTKITKFFKNISRDN